MQTFLKKHETVLDTPYFMAIISKIRQYSTIVIGFIALAILAFILSDLLGSQNGLFSSSGNNRYVGSIAGESISVQDFDKAVKAQTANNRIPESQARDIVWNQLLFEKVFAPECASLGIMVTEEEAKKMVQGDSIFIHTQIRNDPTFQDPKTKKFDKAKVIEMLQGLGSTQDGTVRWAIYEDGLRKDRVRMKYENMMRVSNYITKAEAEREYKVQNEKVDVKYVHIPFASIPDSTLKSQIKDADLQDYLNKNPQKFKAEDMRSLEYITIEAKPSKADSTEFAGKLREIAKEFAKSAEDSVYARTNSDNFNATTDFGFKSPKDLPAELFKKHPELFKGGIYDFLDGKTYKILKIVDLKNDSVNYAARASHILFKADKGANEEMKAKARKEAEEILAKIKAGESFEEMAKKHGSDGTAQNGGDLGWFSKGMMVPPFENAVFNSKEGLLPNLVTTDFGYHIIKVTHEKTNKQYKVAIVNKTLDPSENTQNVALNEANAIKEKNKSIADLRAYVKKNPKLILQKAEKLNRYSTTIGTLQNASELKRWAFNEANVGDISSPIQLVEQNLYVIAVLTMKVEKGEQTINAFRDELTAEVAKQIKIKKISGKIDIKAKTLDDIATKYGKEAQKGETNVTLGKNEFANFGFNPISVGKALGLKEGKRSEIIIDDAGIFILEGGKRTDAPKVADYTAQKNSLKQAKEGMISYQAQEAIKKYRKVEDARYKIYQ